MAGIESFESTLKDAVLAKRLSESKIKSLTEIALKNIESDTQLVSALYRTHKSLPASKKVNGLYVFDALARAARHQVTKRNLTASMSAEKGNCATFLVKMEGVLDGLFQDMLSSAGPGAKDKCKKVLDIWVKANTFPSGVLTRLLELLNGTTNQEPPNVKSTTPPVPPPPVPAPTPAPLAPTAVSPPPPQPPTPAAADAQATLMALLSQAASAVGSNGQSSTIAAIPSSTAAHLNPQQQALLQQFAQGAVKSPVDFPPHGHGLPPIPSSAAGPAHRPLRPDYGSSMQQPPPPGGFRGGRYDDDQRNHRYDQYNDPRGPPPEHYRQGGYAERHGPGGRGEPPQRRDFRGRGGPPGSPSHGEFRGAPFRGRGGGRGGFRGGGPPQDFGNDMGMGMGRGRGRWDDRERFRDRDWAPGPAPGPGPGSGPGPGPAHRVRMSRSRSRSPPPRGRYNGGRGRDARSYGAPARPPFIPEEIHQNVSSMAGAKAEDPTKDEFGREIRPESPKGDQVQAKGDGQDAEERGDQAGEGSGAKSPSATSEMSLSSNAADNSPPPHAVATQPDEPSSTSASASAAEQSTSNSAPSAPEQSTNTAVGLDAFNYDAFDYTSPAAWESLAAAFQITNGYQPAQEELLQLVMARQAGYMSGVMPQGQMGMQSDAAEGDWSAQGMGMGMDPSMGMDMGGMDMGGGRGAQHMQGGGGGARRGRGRGFGGRGRGRGAHGNGLEGNEYGGFGGNGQDAAMHMGGGMMANSPGMDMEELTVPLQTDGGDGGGVGGGGKMQKIGDRWVFVKGEADGVA